MTDFTVTCVPWWRRSRYDTTHALAATAAGWRTACGTYQFDNRPSGVSFLPVGDRPRGVGVDVCGRCAGIVPRETD